MGKGLRIASGCSTLDEFTAVFRKFCTPNSIFFATKNPRARGDEIKFAVSLKDGKVVMRGTGKVAGSFTRGDNPYKRPGMIIEFKVLDTMGKILLAELNAGAASVKPLPNKDHGFEVPTLVHEGEEETKAAPDRSAVDHSDDGEEVTRVSEDSMDPGFDPSEMEEYVECTLVEEEAQEFDDDDDEDEDDDEEEERTRIGPAPSDPALEETQIAAEGPTNIKPMSPKLPGMPKAVRGDPTQQGLGPGGEDATVLAAPPSKGGVPASIPARSPSPSSRGAVPTPVPPAGPRIEGTLPAPGKPHLPPNAPGAMSTQMGMPPLTVPPASARGPGTPPPGGPPLGMAMPPPSGARSTPPPGMGPGTPPPGAGPNTPPPGAGPNTPPPGAGPNTPPPGGALGMPFPVAPSAADLSGGAPPGTPPEGQFRVPSPPQGFRVPTPAELASAVMEPLEGPGQQPPAGMAPPGGMVAGDSQHQQPTGEAEFAPAPGRSQSMGGHTAGQSFPDFVAPAGPMPSPQSAGAAKPAPGGISKKVVMLVAILCLGIGAGGGFLVGQKTAGDGPKVAAAAETTAAGTAVEPTNLVVAMDAGAEALAVEDAAAAALAVTPDATVDVPPDASVDAGSDAGGAVPNTAINPALSDPGEPGEGECALILKLTPADAIVAVNSVKIEAGSTKVNIPCGVFRMTVTHPKYQNHKGSIVLKHGRVTTLEYALKRPSVLLKVTSIPSRALVSLNGEDVGRTPMQRKVPGEEPVQLKLIRSGFKPHVQTVTPSGPTKLKIRMKKRRRRRAPKKKRKTKITL